MMLSRTALRSRHYVFAGGLATAAAVTGTTCYNRNYNTINNITYNEHALNSSASSDGGSDDHQQQQQQQTTNLKSMASSFLPSSATSLIVPTLEASARAARLVSTAVLVTLDYKTDEWGLTTTNSQYDDTGEEVSDDVKKQRDYWEKECDVRKERMEQAQERYAAKYHDNFDLDDTLKLEQSKEAKAEEKKQEKQAINVAAIELAKAEEEFAEVGGVHRKSALHTKAANRLVQLCHKNGGVYIKIGQHLANLDHLIPTEYITALSALFDENPVTDYDAVSKVICEDLGVEHPEDVFDKFCPTPIASASLAQVHVAYDKKTGQKLAVKVQHRGLRETSVGDIYAVVTVVRILEKLFPKQFTYGWIADEIVPNLPIELDFLNEGRNSERAATNLKKTGLDVIVPQVFWERSSPRVLTMAFEEGFKATDIDAMREAGLDRKDVAKLISSVFSSQIFSGIGDPDAGWVHCDPHPANVLIRPKKGKKKPELVLVDHGLYRHLDEEFRIQYAHLWKSLMLADLDGIQEACKKLGVGELYHLFAAMLTARPFEDIIERSQQGGSLRHADEMAQGSKTEQENRADNAVIRGYAQRYLNLIFDLVVSLPRQMLLLLKMNDCLRHIDHALGSPTNTVVVCGSFAARAVYEAEVQQESSSAARGGSAASRSRPSSIVHRWKSWFSYMQVWLKIQIHDIGLWWIENYVSSARRLTAD